MHIYLISTFGYLGYSVSKNDKRLTYLQINLIHDRNGPRLDDVLLWSTEQYLMCGHVRSKVLVLANDGGGGVFVSIYLSPVAR